MKAKGKRQKARMAGSSASQGTGRYFSFFLSPFAFCLAASVFLLAGCGFQLRGTATLPFSTLYVQAAPTSQFAVQLRRAVGAGSGTRIAERPEQAEVILQIVNELQEKQILSLSGGGRVS